MLSILPVPARHEHRKRGKYPSSCLGDPRTSSGPFSSSKLLSRPVTREREKVFNTSIHRYMQSNFTRSRYNNLRKPQPHWSASWFKLVSFEIFKVHFPLIFQFFTIIKHYFAQKIEILFVFLLKQVFLCYGC